MTYTFDKRKINRKQKPSGSQIHQVNREMLPNSLVSRIMEDPGAEKEADRLSQGITSTTPDGIMQEMGSRLNADFSGVRFHSDANSVNRSQLMGARAWAQGKDVYFGKGGFSPSVAAHELVHTVQQGAVSGNVSESMPMGAVQMIPNRRAAREYQQENQQIRSSINELTDKKIREKLTQIFTGSDFGRRIYRRMESSLKNMIKMGVGKNIEFEQEREIDFLAQAAMKDYSSRWTLSSSAMSTKMEFLPLR